MKQVILIHGMPTKEEYYDPNQESRSNCHWFPWIQKQLSKKDILSQALEMPNPYFPVYEKYVDVFEQMKISDETTLVGYSCGGGFLLRYLSEHPEITIKKLVLVAPWLDPEHYLNDQGNKFFDFELDKNLATRIPVHLLISLDDDQPMIDTLARIKSEVPNVIYHEFTNKGHFTKDNLGTEEFPELLDVLI